MGDAPRGTAEVERGPALRSNRKQRENAHQAHDGPHTQGTMSPERNKAEVDSESVVDTHIRLQLGEAADAPRGQEVQDCLPWPRGMLSTTAVRDKKEKCPAHAVA